MEIQTGGKSIHTFIHKLYALFISDCTLYNVHVNVIILLGTFKPSHLNRIINLEKYLQTFSIISKNPLKYRVWSKADIFGSKVMTSNHRRLFRSLFKSCF